MSVDIELLLEEKKFVYDVNKLQDLRYKNINFHFIVVGAGGTGGYIIPNLGRMIGIKNDDGADHSMTIIDADEV